MAAVVEQAKPIEVVGEQCRNLRSIRQQVHEQDAPEAADVLVHILAGDLAETDGCSPGVVGVEYVAIEVVAEPLGEARTDALEAGTRRDEPCVDGLARTVELCGRHLLLNDP